MAERQLTDEQISILFDIGEVSGPEPGSNKERDVRLLIDEGYIELDGGADAARYRLTAKGQRLLADRGAGLNEA